ncbi:MAG: BMP family ABC transporter substrate-binding protein, partial [Clostridiales bacterium]|nr:BMP family ABC transporter substrate-binding protein [Clostridiales bacterium]
DGVEVIFACGGGMGNSVMAAAEAAGAKVIGVDIDQSSESDTVITSAMKELAVSVYQTVKEFYEGNFKGGQNIIFGADNNGVGLPLATSRFETFGQAEYDAIYAKLAANSIDIFKDVGEGVTAANIPVKVVKVTII